MYISNESVILNTDNIKSIIVANIFAYVASKLFTVVFVFVIFYFMFEWVWVCGCDVLFSNSVVAAFAIFDAFDLAILYIYKYI